MKKMATMNALRAALQTLIDNGHRMPEGTTATRLGQHWAKYLEPVQDHELQEAIDKLVLTRWASSWPTIGAILALVPRVQNQRKLESLDDADEIFGRVMRLVASRGLHNPPKELEFDEDPARSKAIYAGIRAVGGWGFLCRSTERETGTTRAAFRKAFTSSKTKLQIEGVWDYSKALSVKTAVGKVLENMEINK
jgi:hypothetical protein